MKFTEEQYHKIVETVNKYPDFGSVYYVQNGWVESKPTNTFNELIEALSYTVSGESEVNMMLALANPLTREWAQEQFVEKEKKYFWSTKKKSKKGKAMTLFKSAGGIAQMVGTKHALTESEIREWGFDPERFDKEEVE